MINHFIIYLYAILLSVDLTTLMASGEFINQLARSYFFPAVYIYIGLYCLLKWKDFKILVSKNTFLLLILVFPLISTIWAYNRFTTLKEGIAMVAIGLIAIALNIDSNKNNNSRVLLFSSLTVVVCSLIGSFTSFDVWHDGRLRGIAHHPNTLGMNAIVVTWCTIQNKEIWPKGIISKFFLVMIALLAAILADSKTSIILILFISTMSIQQHLLRYSFVRYIVFPSLLIILMLSFVYVLSISDDITSAMFSLAGRDVSFTGRDVLWAQALSFSKNNFWLGTGYDGLTYFSQRTGFIYSQLHNGFVEVFVKGGVVGLLVISTFLLAKTAKSIKGMFYSNNLYAKYNVSLMMTIIAHNITESTLYRLTVLWLLLLTVQVGDSDESGLNS